jgi:hypothetical protein
LTALLESDSAHLAADLAQAKDAIRKHRQRPLSRTPEQVHLVLENALREQPVPSLSELARLLGYKGVERLYQVDRNLSKQLSPTSKSCCNNRLPRNGRSLPITSQPVWGTQAMAIFN